ncbi:MAG: tetratricopeptide repeat protein [Verrucomicrobiota bacterium]|nr:tetratricopeptide repeat protein [Verrucomicrobiota bacterium]
MRANWKIVGVCLGLVALIFAAFGSTLRNGFINLDDTDYILKNAQVAQGLTASGIAWAFTHSHSSNWHPLTWISHMLDGQLYGMNARGHHLTNLCLHSATAIALFLFLLRITEAIWRSAFVAALFAIHPLRVESVAWIAERKDVLSGFFFVLTLAAYLRYARAPNVSRYALVLLLFVLGLFSKPMLVTLPIVLLLLDYWPLRRRPWPRLLLEKLPLCALSAASGIVTLIAQREAIQPFERVSILLRVGNALEAVAVYLRQFFWPADLAVFYPWSTTTVTTLGILTSTLLILAITAATIVFREKRYLATGWFWYLAMLVPVIGLVQVGAQTHADRYTYLPQLGLCVLVTWGIADLLPRSRLLLGAGAAAVIVTLALVTRAQTVYWRDSETLWRHAIAVTGENAVAEVYLGEAFSEEGATAKAISHYEDAVRIDPEHAAAYSALGVALLENGETAPSSRSLERALELNPNYAEAHYNLANTRLAAGDLEDALAHYARAIELNPDDYEAENNLAWILATSPRPETRDGARALALATRADALTAGSSPVVTATLAAAYAEAGRFKEAGESATRAIALANAEGNSARAASAREQLEFYRAGRSFRDPHLAPTSR